MAISLKHSFQSAIADGGDTSLVQPSNWNAEHSLTMATSRLLGRTTAGTGSAEEISVGTGLSLSSGSLAVSSTTPQVDSINTFTASQVISVTDNTNAALRITQLGTGEAIRVEDSTNPDSTPFVVDASGDVGIGTATMTSKLNVVGDVYVPIASGIATPRASDNAFVRMLFMDTATNTTVIKGGYGAVSASSVNIAFKNVGDTTIGSIGALGQIGVGGTNFGTSGQTIISAGSSSAPAWGTLGVAGGGTGQSSYTVGDILYASTTTALSKLADVATGNALISGGVGVAPSWGKIGLTTHVSGTLAVGNGGTGLTSYTTGDLVYASGASTLASLADVATGNALISGGVGVAPAWGKVGLTTHVSGTLPLANGGTGATTANAALSNLTTYTTTATAAGTTVLTNTSTYFQFFTGTSTQTITLPVTSTLSTGWSFHIVNNSTGNLTVNSSGGNLVTTVIPGTTAMITCIGTALTTAADWEAGVTDFSTSTGTGSVVLATSPTLTTPNLGTPSAITLTNGTSLPLSTGVTGTLPAANGGTGQSSYAVGDILYASTTTALSKLADVATGNALISGGVGVAPSWGKVGLTTHVSGTLPVTNGGTGVASATAYALIAGGTTSTGAFQSLATGTAGQILTSGGAAALPTWGSGYVVTPTVTSYTSGSGNFTIPSSGTFVLVRAWGGGGSGGRGGGTNARGTGGGGGGYAERLYQLSDLGSGGGTVAYSVAAGGTAVAVAGDGNPGGNSTFSTGATLLTAYGGGGGTGNKATTGGGGGGGALGAGGVGLDTAGGAAGPCGGAAGSYSTSGTTYPGTQWGGGGGGGTNAATALAGNPAYMGGGGGGGAGTLAASGGTSVGGGAGGAASIASGTPGTTGTAPGGGGGAQGANGGSSGAGGAGRIEIWVW